MLTPLSPGQGFSGFWLLPVRLRHSFRLIPRLDLTTSVLGLRKWTVRPKTVAGVSRIYSPFGPVTRLTLSGPHAALKHVIHWFNTSVLRVITLIECPVSCEQAPRLRRITECLTPQSSLGSDCQDFNPIASYP